MCLIGVALTAHPDFPFVLCSNRDEYENRESSEPCVGEDGILCGRDKKSHGTWIGLNTKNGNIAGLTNIGGRGGPGGRSRGALVRSFIESPSLSLLVSRKELFGFNLLWGNLFTKNFELNYVSNCDPDDKDDDSPKVTTLSDGIFGLANDLLGDEYVKCPYVQKRMKQILSTRAPVEKEQTEEVPIETVYKLRDEVGSLFTEQQPLFPANTVPSPLPLLPLLAKFFCFSSRRRIQPGLRTSLVALLICFLLSALFAPPQSYFEIVIVSVVLSFVVGFYHHVRLQHLFVRLPVPHCRYGTISQTVIISCRDGSIHYFYRGTLLNRRTAMDKWQEWKINGA